MAHRILTLPNIDIDLEDIFDGKDVEIVIETDGLTGFARLLKEKFDYIIVPEKADGLDGQSLISALRAINSPNLESDFILIGQNDPGTQNCYFFAPDEVDNIKNFFELFLKGKVKENTTTGYSFSPRGRLRKILFVDDDKELHPLIQKSLRSIYNIESLICSSGAEALEKVGKFIPDLIILDVMMPGLSGTDLLIKLREDKVTKNIPVVFFTGKEKVAELEELLSMGPIGLILKPANTETLSHEIQEIWNEN